MKKIILLTGLCAIVLFSCKKKEDKPVDTDTTPQWENTNATSDIMTYLNSKAPAFNSFIVESITGATIMNDSVEVVIPADAFAFANGTPYNGAVNVKMQTIRSTKDMIYSGVTTVSGGGDLLISDGMFKLEAYDSSNSNKLKLRTGSTISATFPAFNNSNEVFKGREPAGRNNKVEWDRWDSAGVKRMNNNTLVTGLDSLFKYCNLDRFMNGTPLTDITVTTPAGFTNKNTDCFLKYVGENSSAYIPSNFSLKAFSTKGAYYKVVEAKSIKVICYSKKDGKFYYQIKTIASIVTDQTLAMDTMAETTEANLQAVIAAF